MWTKYNSLKLSRIVVYVFYAALAGLCGGLPWLLRWYFDLFGKREPLFAPLMAGLYLSALAALGALLCLDKLLRNMSRGDIFVPQNIRLLRYLSWFCFAVAALFIVFCVYYILGIFITALSAFAGLIVRVVKNVFVEASDIKNENDLTV